jgi:hypothetical protein
VYPELSWLIDHGINVWYDEGIEPGTEWSDAIADAIEGCSTFIYFISPRSITSEDCRRELNYALSHGLNVQAVHLEATTIERGLELSLSNRQAILRHELDEDRYHEKLLQALQQTRGTKSTVPTKAPSRSRRDLRRATVLSIAVVSLAALGLVAVSLLAPAPGPEGSGKTDVFLRPARDLFADENVRFAEALTTEILAKFSSVAGWRSHLLATETTFGDGYVVEPSIRRTAELVWNEIPPRLRDSLMLALHRGGRTAEAAQRHVEVATYAETTPGTTAETWVFWGLTHYAVAEGNFDDAFKWLQLARANDPDFVLLVASLAYTRNQRYATLREDPRFAEVVKWARTPLSARSPN